MRWLCLTALPMLGACLSYCPDCCPPGNSRAPVTVVCRVMRPDGGAAAGVRAACSDIDAGAIAGADGTFALTIIRPTCGEADGDGECGLVTFTEPDGGALSAALPPDAGAEASIHSSHLGIIGCTLSVQ